MGTDTKEYTVFQENFDRLVTAVRYSVVPIARKAFEKKLITHENMMESANLATSEDHRATRLLSQLLNKTLERKENFYTITSILQSIPSLEGIAQELLDQGMLVLWLHLT